jgi:hypothetical protein
VAARLSATLKRSAKVRAFDLHSMGSPLKNTEPSSKKSWSGKFQLRRRWNRSRQPPSCAALLTLIFVSNFRARVKEVSSVPGVTFRAMRIKAHAGEKIHTPPIA